MKLNSYNEEIIAALWIIAAILSFAHGHPVWGWIFGIKAATDAAASILVAARELAKPKDSKDAS